MRVILMMAALGLATLAAGCEDDETFDPIAGAVGAIGPETEIVFEGDVYRPVEAIERSEVENDELTQVGVTEEFSEPYEGEIPVYEREDEDETVYTPAITIDPPGSIDDYWIRWRPAEDVEG